MRVLKFLIQSSKPYHKYIWGMLVAVLVVAMDNTLKPFLVKQFIDIVAGKSDNNLWVIFAMYALLQFMMVSSWILHDYCAQFEYKMRALISEQFMTRLYGYPYTFFQDQLIGKLTAKFGDAFQFASSLIITMIREIGYFVLFILIAIILLANVAPIFAIAMITWMTVFVACTVISLKKCTTLTKNYAEEKSKIIGLVSDYLGNMFNVKTFATKDFELSRFSELKTEYVGVGIRQNIFFIKFYGILGFFTSIYVLGFLIFLIIGYQRGQITPGDFALVIMTNFNITSSFFQLTHTLREFVIKWGALDKALELLEDVPTIQDKQGALPIKVEGGKIIFDNVKFHYKGSEPLFQNKSIIIEAGQKVGLVGYSGGGKTTFINLILRLYEINDGRILIDDQDIKGVTQDSLRQAIGMIPQDPILFNRSLMDNIRYGNVTSSDEEVIEAAKGAHAHEFISKLPKGYESLVGERGVKLSGGQRQRIAIARAILKNAPILILDEATSQLDSITESYIQESLWDLMQNKTTIIIAHRLSTLLHMDRILVFEKGKIIEDGTHAALLELGGVYKTLWNTQIGGFLQN